MTLRRVVSRRLVGVVAVLAICLAASAIVETQRFGRGGRRQRVVPSGEDNVSYDGRFTFVRLRYRMGMNGFGGGRGGRDEPWSHDYPRAERNFEKILDEITLIAPYLGGSNILSLDDDELFKYPLAYMSEPGFWTLDDAETEALRSYLLKGGFIIFDDFRGSHWYNFEQQLMRVLPDAKLVELDVSHPVFHSFFEIETLDFVQFYSRSGRPVFYGVFENNDPEQRLLLIANYNNDIGEYWEFSDTGFVPIDLSNEAYKLGVNYVVYAMTH